MQGLIDGDGRRGEGSGRYQERATDSIPDPEQDPSPGVQCVPAAGVPSPPHCVPAGMVLLLGQLCLCHTGPGALSKLSGVEKLGFSENSQHLP